MPYLRPVPAIFAVAALLASAATTAAWLTLRNRRSSPVAAHMPVAGDPCEVRIARVAGFNHIRPLLYARPACESRRLLPLKQELQAILEQERAAGRLLRSSVYVSDLADGAWIGINGQERYEPGSLMKVATMLAALYRAEQVEGFGARRFRFDKNLAFPHQEFAPSDELMPGREYTLAELLRYSVSLSSNRAESVLLEAVGEPAYQAMLAMLGLPAFEYGSSSYPISAPEYARFFEVLFGASAIGAGNSELALGLLGSSEFRIGLRAGIPAGVDVASKFGETGADGRRQLHEAALVYAPNGAYLIVVMTEGRTATELAALLQRLSAAAYARMGQPGMVLHPPRAA